MILASYSRGARERLTGLMKDHGLKKSKAAKNWQEAAAVVLFTIWGVQDIRLIFSDFFWAP